MNLCTRLLAAIFIFTFCYVERSDGEEFCSGSRLYLLDHHCHTYLFRGMMPSEDGKFCYHEMADQFREALSQHGKQLSPDFMLLSVSFLNCSETKNRKMESQWFGANSDKGCLWRYPLFGNMVNPRCLPPGMRRMIISTDPDGLQSLMCQLRNLVIGREEADGDLVIYLHCRVGKDRTGEAAACYMMQFQGYSYREVVVLCRQIAGRKLRRLSMNAIRWYAFYLRDVLECPWIGYID